MALPSAAEQTADSRATSRLFLSSLYRAGERILIFSNFYSQGDFIAEPGGGSWRLGEKPGVAPVPSLLPQGGREGIWFLTAPVSGEWVKTSGPESKLGRRHEGCATRFPYLLLESDTSEEGLWLRALAALPLPIAALYTSGGRSVHALVKVDCACKPGFDAVRDVIRPVLRPVLCPVGADGAAMTAIRLSRLPGSLRHGKQEKNSYCRYSQPRLVYLNPSPPPGTALVDLLK